MITLILGPMFSGKSSYLLITEHKAMIANKKVVWFKHSIDTRYDEAIIINHDKKQSKSKVIVTDKLLNNDEYIKNASIILIDEGQFFEDILEFCKNNRDKQIFISALSGDFQKEMFKPIVDIIPFVDKIIHQTAICKLCGEDAPFTQRLTANKNQTVVGGIDDYEPRCYKCYVD